MTARLSARRARAIVEAATLAKAPDWAESRRWQVVAEDGTVLVVVAPSYGGTRRNGWLYWLAAVGPGGSGQPYTTREQAAVAGLAAWERWATNGGGAA